MMASAIRTSDEYCFTSFENLIKVILILNIAEVNSERLFLLVSFIVNRYIIGIDNIKLIRENTLSEYSFLPIIIVRNFSIYR
jgi:hypothetical protein